MFKEETVESKYLYNGKILKLRHDMVKLPNGKLAGREIVEHKGAVAIIAVVDNTMLMVKQYRKAVEEELLEIPAGKLEDEDPVDCAIRELKEETGYIAEKNNMIKLYEFYTTPGFSNEKMYLFLTHDLTQDTTNFDDDEFISIEKVEIDKLSELLNNGTIKDAKTIIAIQYYLNYLRDKKL